MRSVQREGRLQSLLHSAVRVVRYVYPSYGAAELVELPFRNPYGADHCFQIVWDDPLNQVSVVSSIDEWRALKVRAHLRLRARSLEHGHSIRRRPQSPPLGRLSTGCKRRPRTSQSTRASGCGYCRRSSYTCRSSSRRGSTGR